VNGIQSLENVVNELLDSYSLIAQKLRKSSDQLRLFQYIYKHSEDSEKEKYAENLEEINENLEYVSNEIRTILKSYNSLIQLSTRQNKESEENDKTRRDASRRAY